MTLHSCFALAFTDPLACQGDLAGGKGANLALLTQKGFPVPPGFIVTAGAYREFVRHTGALLDRVGTFHVDDPALLRQEAAHLRRELESLPLPAEVDQAIRQQLASFPADTAFSVRSSSTFEDLAAAAFAGQHDTYLGISGVESILDRVAPASPHYGKNGPSPIAGSTVSSMRRQPWRSLSRSWCAVTWPVSASPSIRSAVR